MFFTFSFLSVYSQTAKVVGYFPDYRFSLNSQIDYCKVTHLNICFANPDSSGTLYIGNFSTVMSTAIAQNSDITILVAFGGGGIDQDTKDTWAYLIDNPSNRSDFIDSIVEFVIFHQLDGIDVDLEWDAVTPGYSDFIIELKAALSVENKILTAAFPSYYRYPLVTNEALGSFDYINLMAYDWTGPWEPNNPGQHSSYTLASDGISYWKDDQGVDGSRLTLGVPFYGWDFNGWPSNIFEFSYEEMVSIDPDYADVDSVLLAYYNGRPTIESKVALASAEVSGIMIWELGQDAYNQYSLLTTIHNKYTSLGVYTTGLCGNEAVLPISLLYFNVNVLGPAEVEVEWATESEIENDFFTIEKSVDALKWEVVATIKGTGTVDSRAMYRFVDTEPLPGRSYYRLRQTDFDGNATFSNIREANIIGTPSIEIYPNPVNDLVSVKLKEGENASVLLTDCLGRPVAAPSFRGGTGIVEFNTLGLPSGVYFVVVHDSHYNTYKKIVKNG